jgi:hypothetical protein
LAILCRVPRAPWLSIVAFHRTVLRFCGLRLRSPVACLWLSENEVVPVLSELSSLHVLVAR